MQSGSMKEMLRGKYILCVCEGQAEEAIIDLLLDNNKLCFGRQDLVRGKCTRIRQGDRLAREFLGQEYEKEVVILRILDRERERLKLPKAYDRRVDSISIVTKPEIEILYIIAEGLENEFELRKRHKKDLKASEFCQAHFREQQKKLNVKSRDFIETMYGNNISQLVGAIVKYQNSRQQQSRCLGELLD